MTPEKATKLLELTDEVREYRDFVGDVKCWNDPVDGDILEGTKCAIAAADYSMEMLEQISRMSWEYAVRIDFNTGSRLYVRPGATTRYADCALWRAKLEEAQKIADKARTLYTEPVHIIRRLVSEPEEVAE